jgi:hypothetical protein
MNIVSPSTTLAANNRSEAALPVYEPARSPQPYPPAQTAVFVNQTDAPPDYKVTDDDPVVRPANIVATAAMEEQNTSSSPVEEPDDEAVDRR